MGSAERSVTASLCGVGTGWDALQPVKAQATSTAADCQHCHVLSRLGSLVLCGSCWLVASSWACFVGLCHQM